MTRLARRHDTKNVLSVVSLLMSLTALVFSGISMHYNFFREDRRLTAQIFGSFYDRETQSLVAEIYLRNEGTEKELIESISFKLQGGVTAGDLAKVGPLILEPTDVSIITLEQEVTPIDDYLDVTLVFIVASKDGSPLTHQHVYWDIHTSRMTGDKVPYLGPKPVIDLLEESEDVELPRFRG